MSTPTLFISQPYRMPASSVFSALEEVGKCVLIALCVLGAMERIRGGALYLTGLGVYGINTLLHLMQGKLRQRKVEVVTHIALFVTLMSLSFGGATLFAKPSLYFTMLLGAVTVVPLFCSVVRAWHFCEARSLRNAIARLPYVSRCDKIHLPYKDVKASTSALYVTNDTIPYKTVENTISVATYNTALISTWISTKVNHMRNPRERAAEIAAFIREEGRQGRLPDIFCLQECFEPESMKLITEALAEFYPNVMVDIDPPTGETRVGLNSGLAVASRLKMIKARVGHLLPSGTDRFANKDFLILDVEDAMGKQFTVVNAHLVAGDTKSTEQLAELRRINDLFPRGDRKHVIFTADANLPYENVSDKLKGMTFCKAEHGTFYNTTEGWDHNRSTQPELMDDQIDHIAYGAGFTSSRNLSLPSFVIGPHTTHAPASDHHIFAQELTLAPADGG